MEKSNEHENISNVHRILYGDLNNGFEQMEKPQDIPDRLKTQTNKVDPRIGLSNKRGFVDRIDVQSVQDDLLAPGPLL